jgi:two-component system nitrogen regulation response regulator NtrX
MGKGITLGTGALEFLANHDWPGNVRELKNLAERIAVMHQEDVITGEDMQKLLNKKIKKTEKKEQPDLQTAGLQGNLPANLLDKGFNEARENFEKQYLEFHLSKNNGIISRTAEVIGIYPSNLHAKLRKYCITAANSKH